jgi:hypothetical protein
MIEFLVVYVVTLALGSRPKQGIARLQAKKNPKSEGKCEGMNLHTFPRKFPLWEFGVPMNSRIFKE